MFSITNCLENCYINTRIQQKYIICSVYIYIIIHMKFELRTRPLPKCPCGLLSGILGNLPSSMTQELSWKKRRSLTVRFWWRQGTVVAEFSQTHSGDASMHSNPQQISDSLCWLISLILLILSDETLMRLETQGFLNEKSCRLGHLDILIQKLPNIVLFFVLNQLSEGIAGNAWKMHIETHWI